MLREKGVSEERVLCFRLEKERARDRTGRSPSTMVCGEVRKIKFKGYNVDRRVSAVREVQCRQDRWDARWGTGEEDDAGEGVAEGCCRYKQQATIIYDMDRKEDEKERERKTKKNEWRAQGAASVIINTTRQDKNEG
jgi:hypothetical protein